ncbi:hypothetical protein [Metamycoplasma alkalescens]|nr:hypothetical protein [Metamycoplasma alkalescens]
MKKTNFNKNSNKNNLNNIIPAPKKSKLKKFLIVSGTILATSAIGLGIQTIKNSNQTKNTKDSKSTPPKDNNFKSNKKESIVYNSSFALFPKQLNRQFQDPFTSNTYWFTNSFLNKITNQIQEFIDGNKETNTKPLSSSIAEEKIKDYLIPKLKNLPQTINSTFSKLKISYNFSIDSDDKSDKSPFLRITDSKIRSTLLFLLSIGKKIRDNNIFNQPQFDEEKIQTIIPHFKRTNNHPLDQYITLWTLDQMVTELQNNLLKFFDHQKHLVDDPIDIYDLSSNFGLSKYYNFWKKFILIYGSKTEHKNLFAQLQKLSSKTWSINTIEKLFGNEEEQIKKNLTKITQTEYFQSKKNIKSSLKATSHYFISAPFTNWTYFRWFHMFDFDLIGSSLLEYLPQFVNPSNKLGKIDRVAWERIFKNIDQRINDINAIINQLTNQQQKISQIDFLIKQFQVQQGFYNTILKPSISDWSNNKPSKVLSSLNNIYYSLKSISTSLPKTPLISNQYPISKIEKDIKTWKDYLNLFSSLYTSVKLKDKVKNLNSQIKELEDLLSNHKTKIQTNQFHYDNFMKKWNKFLTISKAFDILNKNIENISKSPTLSLEINFRKYKDFKFFDKNLLISLNDIDLTQISKNNVKIKISSPYDKIFNSPIKDIKTSLDGSETILTIELAIKSHPLIQNQKILRTIKLIPSSEKFELFKKIQKKQKDIDDFLTNQKITNNSIKTEFSSFKSIWDKYQSQRITKFQNLKSLEDYKIILKKLLSLEQEFKKKYEEYLEKLKQKLITKFNFEYDEFIQQLDELKETKFQKTVKFFKSKEWNFSNHKFNVYSQKNDFIKTLSIKNQDFKIVSLNDLKNYVKFLEDLNSSLQKEIERINKLFDISKLSLNLIITNQTPKSKLIEAFKQEVGFEISENVDFKLEIKYASYGALGEIKFIADDSKNKLVGELIIPIAIIKKDISKLKLNLKISNSTPKQIIIEALKKSVGFEIIENVDFNFFMRKSTKQLEGIVSISSRGQKLVGTLEIPIPKLQLDDISDLILDLDLSKPINKNLVHQALNKALGFEVNELLDFTIEISNPTINAKGLIHIKTTNRLITGELKIILPQISPIDLSKLKLGIENTINLYTKRQLIIEAFNKTLGFVPKEGKDYALITYNQPGSWKGTATFYPRSNIFAFGEGKSLVINYNEPPKIDISKLIWTKRITNQTPLWSITNEFISLTRTFEFEAQSQVDFQYEISQPQNPNQKGFIKFVGKGFVLINELIIPIFFSKKSPEEELQPNLPVDKEDNTSPDQNNPLPSPQIPKNPSDPNFIPKIIGGTLTALIFLAIIFSIAFVFIKKNRNRLKLELSELPEDNDE